MSKLLSASCSRTPLHSAPGSAANGPGVAVLPRDPEGFLPRPLRRGPAGRCEHAGRGDRGHSEQQETATSLSPPEDQPANWPQIAELTSDLVDEARHPRAGQPQPALDAKPQAELPDLAARGAGLLPPGQPDPACQGRASERCSRRRRGRQTCGTICGRSLYIAFDAMSKPVDDTSQPPLLDQMLMDQILQAVLGRKFGEGKDEPNSPLHSLQNVLLYQPATVAVEYRRAADRCALLGGGGRYRAARRGLAGGRS